MIWRGGRLFGGAKAARTPCPLLARPDISPKLANSRFDPNVWSGRAVQEVSSTLVDTVLHYCIRPLIGAPAPGHHGYQRACGLISRQASTGPFGSPVFACAGKTDLHHRLILSQTSAGKLIMSSVAPHFCAVPLFVPGGRSFVPSCGCTGAPRAKGRQGWPSR